MAALPVPGLFQLSCAEASDRAFVPRVAVDVGALPRRCFALGLGGPPWPRPRAGMKPSTAPLTRPRPWHGTDIHGPPGAARTDASKGHRQLYPPPRARVLFLVA